MLTDRTVIDLLNAFSSPDPTPGGGSAAALAGALGASLLSMVAGMSKTRTGTPEVRAALDAARPGLLELRRVLLDLVDRDATAYDLVVAAYKRPKVTDEDKAARKAAIQAAMRIATEVPVETMAACADAIRAGEPVAEFGNPSAQSDILTGLELLKTGLIGARCNVEINIGSLTDASVVAALSARVAGIGQSAGHSLGQSMKVAGFLELLAKGMAARGPMLSH